VTVIEPAAVKCFQRIRCLISLAFRRRFRGNRFSSRRQSADGLHNQHVRQHNLTGAWNPASKNFSFNKPMNLMAKNKALPLEIFFNKKHDRMFVTTAKPDI